MIPEAKKILIVDDEASIRNTLKDSLKRVAKFKVLAAKSGNMGTWFTSRHWQRPDLIILDLMMPGMDGFEMLKRVKQDSQTKNIPVVVLTGRSDEESREKARSLGCDDYIVKPVEFQDLLLRIEKILADKIHSPAA
jgi:two-component system phosphate regulon response regulator PhoB